MAQIKEIATGRVFAVSAKPDWHGGVWFCGDRNFTDPDKTLYVDATPGVSVVTPPEFMLRFTSPERVALRGLRTDPTVGPTIDDWFKILEDPRLTEVDLALTATQQGVAFALGLLVPAVIPNTATRDVRIAAVLAF